MLRLNPRISGAFDEIADELQGASSKGGRIVRLAARGFAFMQSPELFLRQKIGVRVLIGRARKQSQMRAMTVMTTSLESVWRLDCLAKTPFGVDFTEFHNVFTEVFHTGV